VVSASLSYAWVVEAHIRQSAYHTNRCSCWPSSPLSAELFLGSLCSGIFRIRDDDRLNAHAGGPPDIPPNIWQILSGSSQAIAHHWLPRLVLRRFTQHPERDDPVIWVQSVKAGAARASRVSAECVINDHNTLDEPGSLPAWSIEGVYAKLESEAAPVIRKMLAGQLCNAGDRTAMANFIAAQYTRTPRSRSELTYIGEELMTQKLIVELTAKSDALRARTRSLLEARNGTPATQTDVDTFIDEQRALLQGGTYRVRAPHNVDAGIGLLGIPKIAPIIFGMAWAGLSLSGPKAFVLGDHPLVLHDASIAPDQPAAWLSSRHVEVTFPLAPNFCLILGHSPDGPSYRRSSGDDRIADEINLRSVAHAWRNYYGPTQQTVQEARELAKRHWARTAAFSPVPRGLIVDSRLEGAERPFQRDVFRAPFEIKVSRPSKPHPQGVIRTPSGP
jgi:hypothetical protein